MLIQSPPLSAQLAGLHTAIAAADTHVWLPASLHALIMACLARLFTRLEQILQLWQSGILPAPAPRLQGHPNPAHPPAHRPSPSARRTRRRAPIRAHIAIVEIRTATRAPNRATTRARSPAVTPSTTSSPRTYPARAPPLIGQANPSRKPLPQRVRRHTHIISISF